MVGRAALWPCLRDAFAFLPRAWAGAWGVLIAFGAVLGLAAPLHASAGPASLPTLAAWIAAVGLLKVATYGALLRLAVFGRDARREGLGIGGLQFGRPELRMLGGSALVALFMAVVAVGLFVAVVLITAAAGGETGVPEGAAAWVVRGVQIGAGLVLFVLYVRLSLFAPATVGRRRVVSLDALALAQGSFWTLLIGLVVCTLPTPLAGAAVSPWVHGDPERAVLAAALLSGVLAFVQAPLAAGFLGAVYTRKEYAGEFGGTSSEQVT